MIAFTTDGYCATCRKRIPAEEREQFCADCGASVNNAIPLKQPNKRRRAAVKVEARRAVNVARSARGWTPPATFVRKRHDGTHARYASSTINRTFLADTKAAAS